MHTGWSGHTWSLYRYCKEKNRSMSTAVISRAIFTWCGVILIWRYKRHSTACDGTDSLSPLMRLLAFYDQFIRDYHGTWNVYTWCIDVFMRGHVSEKWGTNGWWVMTVFLPQLAAKQRDGRRYWWRHFYSWCSERDDSFVTVRHIARCHFNYCH